jgi:protein-S-isoprenylcysteine O-methyltransferase Ste14
LSTNGPRKRAFRQQSLLGYTGILTGFLGTAIATTQARGLLAFVLVFVVLWFKLRMEEQWMRNQFGDTYASIPTRVAALVPFIL